MDFLKDLKRFSKKALIIVAHPDDESLFMGGTIAEFRKWRWRVFCVTDCDARYNKRRRKELLNACRIYTRGGSHVEPSSLGVVRRGGQFSKFEVANKIRSFIDKFGPFDIVFTHGEEGEYGHKTHKLVHNVVEELGLPNLYHFIIPYKSSNSIPSGAKYIQSINISSRSRRLKREALNIYLKGSQKTNLMKLRRLLTYALNTRMEWFKKS